MPESTRNEARHLSPASPLSSLHTAHSFRAAWPPQTASAHQLAVQGTNTGDAPTPASVSGEVAFSGLLEA